jgi:hypothetical protein
LEYQEEKRSICLNLTSCSRSRWSRSQWSRGLRQEMSSPAQTLGSWGRIPIRTRISLCIYSVCVSYRPCDGLIPRPRSPTDCLRLRNWSETKRLTDVLCSKWEQQKYTFAGIFTNIATISYNSLSSSCLFLRIRKLDDPSSRRSNSM